MKLLDILNLRRISGQIAALVVVSIIAIHVIVTTTFVLMRSDLNDPGFDRGHGELTALIRLARRRPGRNGRRCWREPPRPFRSSISRPCRRARQPRPTPMRPSRGRRCGGCPAPARN